MDPNSQPQISQQPQIQQQPAQNLDSKSNRNIIIIVAVGFLVLILLGLFGFWYLSNRQQEESDQIQNVEVNQNITPAAEEEEIQDTQGLEDAVNQLGQEDEGLQSEVNQLQQESNF